MISSVFIYFLRREFAELLEKYGSNSSAGSTRNSPIQQGITHNPTPSSSPKSRWYDPSPPEVQRGMTLTRLHLSQQFNLTLISAVLFRAALCHLSLFCQTTCKDSSSYADRNTCLCSGNARNRFFLGGGECCNPSTLVCVYGMRVFCWAWRISGAFCK